MIKIKEEGQYEKLNSSITHCICTTCDCQFSFSEGDIETTYTKVPYEKGIKKFLGLNKGYIQNKYVVCPWCNAHLKLKYIIER